jgi:hypothetical protein
MIDYVIYKENNIITLCIPAYALHILQPLDIRCFLLLKRAYKKEVATLAKSYINYIDKLTFLAAFLAVY